MAWHLQQAKSRFSELVQRAATEGPQVVTVRGKRAAVVHGLVLMTGNVADFADTRAVLLDPWAAS